MTAAAPALAPTGPPLAHHARAGILWVAALHAFRDILQFASILALGAAVRS